MLQPRRTAGLRCTEMPLGGPAACREPPVAGAPSTAEQEMLPLNTPRLYSLFTKARGWDRSPCTASC